jgi:hypothetical protein
MIKSKVIKNISFDEKNIMLIERKSSLFRLFSKDTTCGNENESKNSHTFASILDTFIICVLIIAYIYMLLQFMPFGNFDNDKSIQNEFNNLEDDY